MGHGFILQDVLIAPFFVWGVSSYINVSQYGSQISSGVRGVFRIFIEAKLSNLSALLVLSQLDM